MAATWIADALRARGLAVDESLVPDWQSRTHTDGPTMGTVVGVMGHHTAGGASGNLPSLGIVRDGRAGLAGPLANLMLARDGTWVPIAAGRCWHAGGADNPGAWPWVPNGDANGYVLGVEAESVGTADDWTAAQRESYPRGVAALLAHQGLGADRFLGHKEWAPTRKIDPANWDMGAFRAAVTRWLTTSTGGLFMSLTPEQELRVLEWADKGLYSLGAIKAGTDRLEHIQQTTDQTAWGVLDDKEGLRVAVSGLYAKLASTGGGAITAADVAAAIPSGIAQAVADELQRRLSA